MKRIVLALVAIFGVLLGADAASAKVNVAIDLSSQRMTVSSSSGSYVWPISSARSGFSTPRGSYAPTSLQRMHYSHKYHMSPMPYSIFFRGGYAIHGTYSTGALGRPASHGCVRLSPGNAATLFSMVQREGASISISGSPPGGHVYASNHHRHRHTMMAQHHAHHMHALAYAPHHHFKSVKSWQRDPVNY